MNARLEVDLDAFAANLAVVRERVAPAHHMLVVKDDAYGHGLVPVIRRARNEGVRWFGAFDVRTGCAVRAELGSDVRVFAWILASRDEIAAAVDAELDLGIGDAGLLEDVAAVAGSREAARPVRVHVKVDTGLHRNGVRPEEWPQFAARTAALARRGAIEVAGLWSHISEASDADDDAARAGFESAIRIFRAAGVTAPVRHLAASAAAFARPEFRYDLVRIGAFAYGIRSAGGASAARLRIRPIATLRAPVVSVGVDGARIALGAFDGLPSTLAGRILVGTPGGPRALREIAHTDSLVAGWPGASVGQSVAVFGAAPVAPHSATGVAETIHTIGEEIATRLSPLVERVYVGE